MRLNITILDDYTNLVRTLPCVSLLGEHKLTVHTDCERNLDALSNRLQDTDAIVLLRERTKITAELIARLPRLKLITLNGPYPHVDVDACTKRGIVLCSEHARTSYATAELTWGLIIAAMRDIPRQMARLKSGQWQDRAGYVLRGRTLGIYGYGRIGKQVAGFGRAFGMRVLVWSREAARAQALADGYEVAATREALFDEADVLSMHIRLVAETRGIVTAADLARMKPAAVFVNTSRAELVPAGVLAAALRAGRPGAAAVDVYENEPVMNADNSDSALLQLDNVIATPHLGYMEHDQMNNYFSDNFKRVLAFADGKPYGVVNPETLKVK
jgi:D-3-phosphoglycerate dehydrogenase / 2-oxoglutarate reductase